MKKQRFFLDFSDGLVLGIAIDRHEIQIGILAWIITIKFKL